MVDILPFRGVRYDTAAAGAALADLVAPPYDVISPSEQDALYQKHPENVVRLILGREDDKYARARALFQDWLARGILKADSVPSVYVYHQTFDDPVTGKRCPERMGLICLLKLEEYGTGKVLPHERTLTQARADRLELMRATEAQFESIYGLYPDPDYAVQSFLREYDDREPIMEQVDSMIGSSHRVERITDANAHRILRDLMADKAIFIADGHHRYETALQYRREVQSPAADYILITLTALEDEGLLVLPTHRIVRNVPAEKIAALPSALAAEFTVTAITPDAMEQAIEEAAKEGRVAFGVLLPHQTLLATLTANPGSDAVGRLPVMLLGHLVLEELLGIDAAAVAAGNHVGYTRDIGEARTQVDSGAAQAAFVLGRPTVGEIREVSLAGDVMPQKSTFFFPKLLSGLLLRSLALDNPQETLTFDADE